MRCYARCDCNKDIGVPDQTALPVHLQGITDHFPTPLGAEELASIRTTLAKLVPPDRRPG